MQYKLYDILTIEDKKYIVASMIVEENNYYYYLLLETDDQENINSKKAKICKQMTVNNIEPDKLYPVVDKEELDKVATSLYAAMQFDLDEE